MCEVYYEVDNGKLKTHIDKIKELINKGYISEWIMDEILMVKRNDEWNTDEELIDLGWGYKEKRKYMIRKIRLRSFK